MDRNQGWNRSNSGNPDSAGYHEYKTKIKQLSRELSLSRRNVDEFESKFEEAHGYKPSLVSTPSPRLMQIPFTMRKNLPKTLDQLIFCKYTLVFSKFLPPQGRSY